MRHVTNRERIEKLIGWRDTTVDVDLKPHPEPVGIFDALPRLKDEIEINIELASPDDFIPPLAGWQERSPFIARRGLIDFHHYDFYAQALAKIERDHERDRRDVEQMFLRGLVEKERLRAFFREIESKLARYPAIDPATFHRRVEEACQR